ncbi:hypothetical protein BVY04_03705 [bacterium M21]|nr:hypothetical protein BVY04_03705 [bacterium M21]
MIAYWTVLTGVFSFAMHVTLGFLKIEIELVQELVVIGVASLSALIPVVGPYLAFVVATYLLYRMADEKFGEILMAVALTRVIATWIAIGLLSALPG